MASYRLAEIDSSENLEWLLPASGLLIGTLLATVFAIIHAHVRSNPGKIPLWQWFGSNKSSGWWRCWGLVGVYYALLVWVPTSFIAYNLLRAGEGLLRTSLESPRSAQSASDEFLATAAIAFLLPIGWRGIRSWRAGRTRELVLSGALERTLQRADEVASLYFVALISETLGALSAQLVDKAAPKVIQSVYSEQLETLITRKASRLPEGEKDRALGLIRVSTPMQQIRYLLGHLGYPNVVEQIDLVSAKLRDGVPLVPYDLTRLDDPGEIDYLLDPPDDGLE